MVKKRNELDKGIVLFDDECNFCNSTVLFLIKYDKRREKKKKAQKDRIVHPVDIDSAYRSGRFHCHECFYRGKRCRGGK